jgi:hypothetical protein
MVILSFTSATIILCFEKWKLLEWYQIYLGGRYFFPKEPCLLCLGFQLSMLQVAVIYLFKSEELLFLIPFASASFTRAIYSINK